VTYWFFEAILFLPVLSTGGVALIPFVIETGTGEVSETYYEPDIGETICLAKCC
jgi:quinol-cytochrome oxidoreductase complex cytochrome b subunit